MGLVRSLSGGEIVAQIWLALRAARATGGALPVPRQIVFMGMGDAGANHVEAALAAVVLTDGDRFGFSKRRLTLSTVGPSPRAFKALAAAPGTLAWSLHAVDEGLRKVLVPSAAHSPRELRDGLLDALAGSPETGPLMLAVTLLAGVNDGAGDAAALAAFVAPIRAARSKTIVDLIPYNPLPGDDAFARPSFARVAAFQRTLRDSSPGLFVGVRSARGDDERAACGQLATDAAARAREPG
jgi:23S rRNA (adenine2503-C2)-methyltransferase